MFLTCVSPEILDKRVLPPATPSQAHVGGTYTYCVHFYSVPQAYTSSTQKHVHQNSPQSHISMGHIQNGLILLFPLAVL